MIDALYDEVYIHKVVYDELLLSEVKQNVDAKLNDGWILFDPDDEDALSDYRYEIYNQYLVDVKQGFTDLDEKKTREGRPLKYTNDLGEMHSLAAAMLLGASIIFSNDYDILEDIKDSELRITVDEAEDSELIQHDTLVDFCFYLVVFDIEAKANVRKFLKAIQPFKVSVLDERLKQFQPKETG
ncbi:hypothetical protein [Lysinibacillus xylanilyticus]|uniref:PIN domain-containing protein n=1 Tax=Lysinibacillus xylanilyticus TaxID=582475 RepID=A0A2M9QA49_9BACI|nr:hypothetical protein [Lysinibacillus xylanilyticus]PJO44892.1 hypothetical protein CWD94_04185 [Lysinibacillus xylanilyticus]